MGRRRGGSFTAHHDANAREFFFSFFFFFLPMSPHNDSQRPPRTWGRGGDGRRRLNIYDGAEKMYDFHLAAAQLVTFRSGSVLGVSGARRERAQPRLRSKTMHLS